LRRKHFASLDGLRGLAILAVVAYHYFPHRGTGWFGYLASASWAGVDLFFVLSGFLITGILFDTLNTKNFYKNFYMRRVLRLFPVYLVFMCVVLLIARGTVPHLWAVALSYLLYAPNLVRLFDPGIFTVGSVQTGHLWSLAVEEQFYLIWPWIIVSLGSRRRILRFCIYGSIATLALRLILIHVVPASGSFFYIELPTRADSLLIGAAVAMIFRDPELRSKVRLRYVRIAGLAAAAGFLALGLSIHTFFWQTPPISTWGFSLTAIASAALVFLAMTPGTWTSRIFSNSVLRLYGRYSYGLYLIHFAPKYYYDEVFLPAISNRVHPAWLAGTIGFAIVLAASTAAAVLSFHIIEMPFLKMKKRFESGSRKESKPREKELVTPESVESET
jgi:peptidoglycan/LPS O-acetylase OafA/YrhL